MIIQTTDFAGIMPIIRPHMLSENQAQDAYQCKFINGNLLPFKDSPQADGTSAVPYGTDSFFPYRDGAFWITSSHDMDIVLGPIVDDEQNRVYRTHNNPENPYPQMSYEGQVENGVWFRLGLPAPAAAPQLSSSYTLPSGSITDIASETPLVVTSAGHGLEDNDQVRINISTGMTRLDDNIYSVEVVDSNSFKLSGTAANDDELYEGGGTWELYRDESDKESRGYAYTYVTPLGEESLPSDISTIDVYSDEAVELTAMSVPPTTPYNLGTGSMKRIYRSVTSSTGTKLYYIGEIPATTTAFTDDIDPTSIGEPLPSESWDAPPEDMRGLKAMANGILVGFSGRDVCFSVPYVPHAWPLEYRVSVDSPVVALGVMGQSIVILTEEQPYIATGTDSASMTLEKLDINQSCVSKQGVVDMGFSVIYPSPDGLVEVGRNGVNLVTKAIFTRDQWQAIKPETIRACFWEGKYIFFSTEKGYLYSPTMPTMTEFAGSSTFAGYNDLSADELYFLSGTTICKIESGDSVYPYRWKSKLFRLPRPESLSCAQVFRADDEDVTFTLFADGVQKFQKTITDNEPFRLPASFLAVDYEFQLEGTGEVQAVYLASSMKELAQV